MHQFRILLVFVVFMLTVPTAGAETDGSGSGGPPAYVSLEPFIVNVSDGSRVRHMQVTTQLKLSSSNLQKFIEEHNPAIRHEMVMLLSDQAVAEVRTVQGKEKLRSEALTALQTVMQNNIGIPAIDAVYFTGLIIQ